MKTKNPKKFQHPQNQKKISSFLDTVGVNFTLGEVFYLYIFFSFIAIKNKKNYFTGIEPIIHH